MKPMYNHQLTLENELSQNCTTRKVNRFLSFYSKFVILGLLFILTCGARGYSQYSIPSYNVFIEKATQFIEGSQVSSNQITMSPMEKRVLYVHTSCISSPPSICEATVWVYSLDGQTILGPYTMECGGTLGVAIDDRTWGVYVLPNTSLYVDVFIL